MALETQGYQFQAPIPDLSREHPLTSLKALSFSGGGNSPLNVQPLAGWKVESAHPENVAIGAIQGAGAIGQGITAAYMSKQAKKEAADALAKSQAREDLLLQNQYNQQTKLANLRLAETTRHNEDMMALRQRIVDVGANKHPTAPSIRGGIAPDKQKLQKSDSQQEPISSDPNDLIPNDEHYNNLKGVGEGGDTSPLPDSDSLGKPFGNISVPDIEKATIQYNPLNISTDTQYLTTSGLNPNVPVNPATANPNFPYDLQAIDPRQVVSAAQQFGQQSTPVQQQVQALLSSIPPAQVAQAQQAQAMQGVAPVAGTAAQPPVAPVAPVTPQVAPKSEQPESIPEFDRIIGVDKMMPEQDAIDIKNYARAKGMIEPEIKQDENNPNNFKVVWPTTAQQLEFAKNKQAEEDRKQKHIDDMEVKYGIMLIRNQRAFRTDKLIMNYLDRSSPRSMLSPFISAYETAKLRPQAQGASDIAMLDSYARAMSGGRVTEGQANLILQATSLAQKMETLTGKPFTGKVIAQDFRDQMLRELIENVNISADQANKQVSSYKAALEKGGMPHQKITLNYFLGGHTPETQLMVKSDAVDKIKHNANIVKDLLEKEKTADPDSASLLRKQIESLKSESQILHDRLHDDADPDSSLLGAKEMRDIHHLEGWTGGDVNLTEMNQ
jgi:hypothetical protein